jgi:hypothetical protein
VPSWKTRIILINPELRNQIYSLILADEPKPKHRILLRHAPWMETSMEFRHPSRHYIGLTQVSKRMHFESLPL